MTDPAAALASSRARRAALADLADLHPQRLVALRAEHPTMHKARKALATEHPGAMEVLAKGWLAHYLTEAGRAPRPVGDRSGGLVRRRRERQACAASGCACCAPCRERMSR